MLRVVLKTEATVSRSTESLLDLRVVCTCEVCIGIEVAVASLSLLCEATRTSIGLTEDDDLLFDRLINELPPLAHTFCNIATLPIVYIMNVGRC